MGKIKMSFCSSSLLWSLGGILERAKSQHTSLSFSLLCLTANSAASRMLSRLKRFPMTGIAASLRSSMRKKSAIGNKVVASSQSKFSPAKLLPYMKPMIADRTLKEHSSTLIVDFCPPTAVFRAVLKYSDLKMPKILITGSQSKNHYFHTYHNITHPNIRPSHLNSRMAEWAKIVSPSQTRVTSALSLFWKSSDIFIHNWDCAMSILRL